MNQFSSRSFSMFDPQSDRAPQTTADHPRQTLRRPKRPRTSPKHRTLTLAGLSILSAIAWSVGIPMVVGLAVGAWIDTYFLGSFAWIAFFLIIGVLAGCLNGWYWVLHEIHER